MPAVGPAKARLEPGRVAEHGPGAVERARPRRPRRAERRGARERGRAAGHAAGEPAAEPPEVRRLDVRIAPEHLVAAVAGQEHGGAVLGREASREVRRDRRGVGEGHTEGADEGVERGRRLGAEHDFPVAEAEGPRDVPRSTEVAPRIALGAGEADRERGGCRPLPARQAGDDARVDAAREEDADRHVGDEAAIDRVRERVLDARLPSAPRPRGVLQAERPPAREPLAALRHLEEVPRRQRLHVAVDAQLLRHEAEVEIGVDGVPVDGRRVREGGGERLGLRGEGDRAPQARDPEGLHAEPVAREDEAARALVPEGEGEHAVQALEEARAPLLEAVHQDLGVRGAREDVAASARTARSAAWL